MSYSICIPPAVLVGSTVQRICDRLMKLRMYNGCAYIEYRCY